MYPAHAVELYTSFNHLQSFLHGDDHLLAGDCLAWIVCWAGLGKAGSGQAWWGDRKVGSVHRSES